MANVLFSSSLFLPLYLHHRAKEPVFTCCYGPLSDERRSDVHSKEISSIFTLFRLQSCLLSNVFI